MMGEERNRKETSEELLRAWEEASKDYKRSSLSRYCLREAQFKFIKRHYKVDMTAHDIGKVIGVNEHFIWTFHSSNRDDADWYYKTRMRR